MLQFFNKKQGERGFTLIELLVVIAIIGILATIVLVSLNSARSKSRDVRRASDLRQIQLGEEIYWDKNSSYAVALNNLSPDGMSAVPEDPSGVAADVYAYGTGANCPTTGANGYIVGVLFENDNANLMGSSRGEPSGTCTWVGAGRNAKGVNVCGAGRYYCVSP